MALLFKPLRCPHCQEPINKAMLKRQGKLQTFLKRKPFPCPHCEQLVVFPENGDTTLSMGIFIAAVLAPLFHFWEVAFIDSKLLFGVGVGVIIVGALTQKLKKASQ